MKLHIYIFAIIFLYLSFIGFESHAEEVIDKLSLGYGCISQVIDDPKAPPPTLLTAKYKFGGTREFKPYLGTGLAYTIHNENKSGDNTKITAGVAGQAGFRYLLNENSFLNIDYRCLLMPPAPNHNDSTPQSVGVGVKIQF
ncbi:MAG: outer membrane beta-barrel protein [Geobacter sp.]|nr:outer membrane beta-barrel protein [Geobacter sp.]